MPPTKTSHHPLAVLLCACACSHVLPDPAPSAAHQPPVPAAPREATTAPPAPEPELAALPLDVRLPSRAMWEWHYLQDCKALAASPCELTADLDGDGTPDRVVETRDETFQRAGIAVLWGGGAVSIIGAGASSRQLRTDVHADGVDLTWIPVEDDLSFVTRWMIVPRSPDGFVAPASAAPPPPGRTAADHSLPAPAATGAGVWLDGGDAAEVLYWDGSGWRRLIVGF
jgi:hypothetical protein